MEMRFSVKAAVNRQINSITEAEATENFVISCKLCCNSGFNMDCDRCLVASAYEQKCAVILDLRKIEAERQRQKEREKQTETK